MRRPGKFFAIFDTAMNNIVNYYQMDGKISLHKDYTRSSIGVMFKFTHKYLTIKDIINFDLEKDRREILNNIDLHLKEIKSQFNYYFNAIWC